MNYKIGLECRHIGPMRRTSRQFTGTDGKTLNT